LGLCLRLALGFRFSFQGLGLTVVQYIISKDNVLIQAYRPYHVTISDGEINPACSFKVTRKYMFNVYLFSKKLVIRESTEDTYFSLSLYALLLDKIQSNFSFTHNEYLSIYETGATPSQVKSCLRCTYTAIEHISTNKA